mmetsp:Transcript_59989/g.130118  ORF Transcript_59989/g.130118 Transcript_59989/m.130118 type:complete len:230 (-) Transcript_59989:1831-2520(-)
MTLGAGGRTCRPEGKTTAFASKLSDDRGASQQPQARTAVHQHAGLPAPGIRSARPRLLQEVLLILIGFLLRGDLQASASSVLAYELVERRQMPLHEGEQDLENPDVGGVLRAVHPIVSDDEFVPLGTDELAHGNARSEVAEDRHRVQHGLLGNLNICRDIVLRLLQAAVGHCERVQRLHHVTHNALETVAGVSRHLPLPSFDLEAHHARRNFLVALALRQDNVQYRHLC